MALTLPYPSMNFVPLDVLTAAEQNQLVTNIEYIASQFPAAKQDNFPNPAQATAYYGTPITITTAGKYICYCSVETYATGTSGVLFVYIRKNNTTNLLNTQFTTKNSARVSGDAAILLDLAVGDDIRGGFYLSNLGDSANVRVLCTVTRAE